MGDGYRPHPAAQGCNGFCHTLNVKDVDSVLRNGLANLVNHEDYTLVGILFKVATQVIVKFVGIIVQDAQLGGIKHLVVGTLRAETVEHGFFQRIVHNIHVLTVLLPRLATPLLRFFAKGLVPSAHEQVKLDDTYPVIVKTYRAKESRHHHVADTVIAGSLGGIE